VENRANGYETQFKVARQLLMQTSSADLIKVGVAVWEMEHMN
jgi:hypothetical protein